MDRCRRTVFSLVIVMLTALTTGPSAFSATALDKAIRLQREGRNREAQRALRALLPDLRASNDRPALARALAAATDAALALGEYESAIQEAREAFDIHQQLGQRADCMRSSRPARRCNRAKKRNC